MSSKLTGTGQNRGPPSLSFWAKVDQKLEASAMATRTRSRVSLVSVDAMLTVVHLLCTHCCAGMPKMACFQIMELLMMNF
ncbi:hypothetical protein CKAN_00423300 [Cinnamomum micranthum f. kanehirae]|uniref:Uncharacterized protein n=1 Tax=Cinnamomum micranthum f. kanehirae TaxID=337451 RepID=A0A3S3M9V7_9MAGN|nr:hypothetical protein CKAN_00423300 [Cinnamomum micranthum f. kanehirae]